MKVLYFDCSSGISGNMTLGALMELIDDPDYLQKELAKLKVDGYHLHVSKNKKEWDNRYICGCLSRRTSSSSPS